jgi:hypothetical protein
MKAICFIFRLAGLLVGGAAIAEAGPLFPAEAIRALNAHGSPCGQAQSFCPCNFSHYP